VENHSPFESAPPREMKQIHISHISYDLAESESLTPVSFMQLGQLRIVTRRIPR